MNETALYNFIPKFCPNCGTETRADFADFRAGASCTCRKCGISYAHATTEALRVAATASGGDLVAHQVGYQEMRAIERRLELAEEAPELLHALHGLLRIAEVWQRERQELYGADWLGLAPDNIIDVARALAARFPEEPSGGGEGDH